MSVLRPFTLFRRTLSAYSPTAGEFSLPPVDKNTKTDALQLLEVPELKPEVRPIYISSLRQSSQQKIVSSFMNIPPQEDPLLHLLASCIMRRGQRTRASKIVSRTLLHIHAYTRAPALPILRHAIFSIAPAVRTMNHKRSTKMVYKPVPLTEKQSIHRAIEWLLESTKHRRTGDKLEERLAREIIDIIQNPDNATLKKTP